jgi:uncharacterized protein (DUF2252 family)
VSGRDPVAEIIAYNKPLTEPAHRVQRSEGPGECTLEALRRKLDALAASPFQFFRGTFHLMASDLFQERVPGAKAAAPEGLIVGDLHLENFGIYRGASGALCFDVNDFDDVGYGPVDLDLRRLCTSAMLVPGLAQGVRLTAARAIARAWAEELVKMGGRFPIPIWGEEKAEGRVKELLRDSGRKTREDAVARIAPDKGHSRLVQGDKFIRPAKSWVQIVEQAFAQYCDNLKQLRAPDAPKGYEILDVAYRFKGTGSLGRLRFSVLLGQGGERRLIELKEARPSALDDARGRPPLRDRARVQTASIRRMQADPWPRVASTTLGKVAALGRENEPEEEKIGCERFAQGDTRHEELSAYARQCGQVLARMHARVNAPILLGAHWSADDAARSAVEFAEKYAAQVEIDQKAFAKARGDAGKELGVL